MIILPRSSTSTPAKKALVKINKGRVASLGLRGRVARVTLLGQALDAPRPFSHRPPPQPHPLSLLPLSLPFRYAQCGRPQGWVNGRRPGSSQASCDPLEKPSCRGLDFPPTNKGPFAFHDLRGRVAMAVTNPPMHPGNAAWTSGLAAWPTSGSGLSRGRSRHWNKEEKTSQGKGMTLLHPLRKRPQGEVLHDYSLLKLS
ncbi:uncharacterized protein LOC101015725 [Papio anubis]|uniref:uncharacterized protein LOC101015725 n=1 Tax=Papio anubis TaxID=9555 RepID=UPI0012ADB8E9|nr:uncharacterized protein LOC101015725 [Papio anubis]